MSKYTITISTDDFPDDESGLQKVVQDYNDSILPDGIPLTVEEYLIRVMQIAIKSYSRAYIAAETKIISVKFERADASTRQTTKDALAAIDGSGGGGGVQFQPTLKV